MTERLRSATSAASMATRLPSAVILVSLVSLVIAITVGVRSGSDLARDLTDDRLVAMRASAAADVATDLRSLSRTADALAASPTTAEALIDLTDGFRELLETSPSDLTQEREELVLAYQERYLAPLAEAGRERNIRDLVADNAGALYLQHNYAVDLGPITDPALIDSADDGSTWSSVHAEIHPIYRDVVDRLDLADLFLVEPASGVILYSTEKRPDLGTSLDVGPFSGSFLARVVDEVRSNSRATALSDLSFYDPTLLRPVGAVASPVRQDGRLVGMLVLMYYGDRFSDLLTADAHWDDAGFPPTGETFLIGSDGVYRSEPRGFIESRRSHVDDAVAAGDLTESQADFVSSAGTVVLTQPVSGQSIDSGLDGDASVMTRTTAAGTEAFSAMTEVAVEGLGWFAVSEVDVAAAERDINDFVELLVVGTAVFVVGLAFAAVAWAGRIVRPIRAISERLRLDDEEFAPVELPERSPIEFRRLAESFESMTAVRRDQQLEVAAAKTARLDLLRRMLPPTVADRVGRGDADFVEEVPQATVVAIVLHGLDALVDSTGGAGRRALVDQIYADLDDLADRHGLERLKVVGDTYFASCGHGRPYLDHAPRVAAFVADACASVREHNGSSAGIDASAGVDTGPVTIGVASTPRLLYDVWGTPVATANKLARGGQPGDQLLTDATQRLLPDSIDAVARDNGPDGSVWVMQAGPIGVQP